MKEQIEDVVLIRKTFLEQMDVLLAMKVNSLIPVRASSLVPIRASIALKNSSLTFALVKQISCITGITGVQLLAPDDKNEGFRDVHEQALELLEHYGLSLSPCCDMEESDWDALMGEYDELLEAFLSMVQAVDVSRANDGYRNLHEWTTT